MIERIEALRTSYHDNHPHDYATGFNAAIDAVLSVLREHLDAAPTGFGEMMQKAEYDRGWWVEENTPHSSIMWEEASVKWWEGEGWKRVRSLLLKEGP